jgi:hypothetical protein
MSYARGDGVQQQRSAGDRLHMPVWLGKTRKDVPPVIEQRDEACRQMATREIVCGEAAPAPLVFQFVENIFRVAAISIHLAEDREIFFEGSHQDAVFVNIGVGADFDEGQLLLIVITAADAAQSPLRRRRITIARRCRLQPSSLTVASLASKP